MSKRYPCPMVGCDHQFTAEELIGVTVVTCPRCGTKIQLRSAVSANPLPAFAPPPLTPQPPVVQTTARRRSRDVLIYSAVIGGFLLLVAFGIVAAVVSSRSGKGGITRPNLPGYRNADYLFALDLPTLDWEDHPGMKARLQVSQFAAMSSDTDPRYVALDVLDYKDRTPSARELDAEARRKLSRFFSRRFETDPPEGAPLQEGPMVADKPTHRFRFDGQSPDDELTGYAVYFAYEQFGYWLYYLRPPGFQGDSEWQAVLDGFRLTGRRPRSATTPKESRAFSGKDVTGFRLIDTTGRWQLEDDPKAHDPQADIVLRAMDPTNPRKPTLAADLLVIQLPKEGDPLEQVKAHLRAKQQREGNPNSQIVEIEGTRTDKVGNNPGTLIHWRIDNGGVRDRMAVVAIVPRGDQLLVLYGDCPWDRRFAWEEAFEQLISTLQLDP